MIKYCVLLVLLAACSAASNVTKICGREEVSKTYLDIAIDMITKAKSTVPECKNCTENPTHNAIDCAEILRLGHKKSGAYKIWPMNRVTEHKSIDVYCDMETNGGGWTLIQRRGNFQRPIDYFAKDWKSYKEGFGDIEKDFWLGNDNIFALTNQRLYSARFDLEDVGRDKRHAQYDTFWIDDEYNNFALHLSNYSGDAGDSMAYHNNQKFTTRDRDNDNEKGDSCATSDRGGWWYNECYVSNLNGVHHRGKYGGVTNGIVWIGWKEYDESLASTEIKIRPKSFRPSYDTIITPMK